MATLRWLIAFVALDHVACTAPTPTRVVSVGGRPVVVGMGKISAPANWSVEVDFAKITRVSRTTTTLQVVSNPILERTLTAPNGTVFPNPIHANAWASLAALEADLVRYVPWYPYPKKSVAELDAPVPGKQTSWDFKYILPELEDFMNNVYSRNHSTVLNFATQPCWLFGNATNQTQDCSYPKNPDESFFAYVRGSRANLLDPTGKDLAGYFARLLSYIVKGEFTDEHGVRHTGGPAYKNYNRAHGHVWELFNEAEHQYSVDQYIHDYDVVVQEMINAVGGLDNAPAFMGIGGASPDWITPFLDSKKHVANPPPIDYISAHFYAGCGNRTDPSTYAPAFFSAAGGFVNSVKLYVAQRDASSFPKVKIDLDELGVIMPDDNDANFGIDANLPDIYWNAAGAMFAYLFVALAPVGVEVLGHSQLAGSPKIPEWGIPLPQFPSVSLLDWRTGHGNARYWVLKLLIEEFAPGDKLASTKFEKEDNKCHGTNPVCSEVTWASQQYLPTTLRCCEPGATITNITFADWGSPTGECGIFKSNPSCSAGMDKVLKWAKEACLGKQSCTLSPYPALGDPCPYTPKRFVAEAVCSGTKGGTATQDANTFSALAAVKADGTHKVLLVNHLNEPQKVTLSGLGSGAIALHMVAPSTVQAASANGIGHTTMAHGDAPIMLEPFAVVVVTKMATIPSVMAFV